MNPMETVRRELEKMRAAAGRGDDAGMASALRGLDDALREHRNELPPQLAHFLERRSYEKARRFIETEDSSGDARTGEAGA